MKKTLVYLVLFSLLVQIGCSGITQIPYPVDESKSENEIRQLNYFGERLNSTIQFTNSIEVEAYWLKMKDDKIYLLTEGLDDTTSVTIDKIKTIRFFDWWRGCLFGGLGGLVYWGALGIAVGNVGGAGHEVGISPIVWVLMALPIVYGVYALSDRDFNFVQSN